MDEKMKKRILLVEDDATLAEMYLKKFDVAGFDVLSAHDGEKGLAMALEEKPDIILLDLLMPIMDGMTTMKKLREDAWGKNVPIIILTNLNANDKIIQRITEDHPAYYLMKTNDTPSDVVMKIKDVLKI